MGPLKRPLTYGRGSEEKRVSVRIGQDVRTGTSSCVSCSEKLRMGRKCSGMNFRPLHCDDLSSRILANQPRIGSCSQDWTTPYKSRSLEQNETAKPGCKMLS